MYIFAMCFFLYFFGCERQSHFGRSSRMNGLRNDFFVCRTWELNFPVVLRENDNLESMSTPIRCRLYCRPRVRGCSRRTLRRYGVRDELDIARSLRRALFSVARKTPWKYFLSPSSAILAAEFEMLESMSLHEYISTDRDFIVCWVRLCYDVNKFARLNYAIN